MKLKRRKPNQKINKKIKHLSALIAAGEHEAAYTYVSKNIPQSEDKHFYLPYHTLGKNLFAKRKPAEAILILAKALPCSKLQKGIKNNIGICFSQVIFKKPIPEIKPILIQAISEVWGPLDKLLRGAISYLKIQYGDVFKGPTETIADRKTFLSDELVLLTINNIVPDHELEKVLCDLRRLILIDIHKGLINDGIANFLTALASHNYLNEYVHIVSQEEKKILKEIKNDLKESLLPNPTEKILIALCYTDINGLEMPLELIPKTLQQIIAQQVLEPHKEREIKENLQKATIIEDNVSIQVQAQYEENPYPRWKKLPSSITPTTPNKYLQSYFEKNNFDLKEDASILIAGCGTGQQSSYFAKLYPRSEILAVDLSLSSLAYAQKKSDELGIKNITYKQADILKLEELNRRFDFIICSGVLHHMENPSAGLMVLKKILNPNGVLEVCLYSETARKSVVAARKLIKEKGFKPEPQDIRECRKFIANSPDEHIIKKVMNAADFYSMSGCRDLLFHVQEHRYTLPQVQQIEDQTNLKIIGLIPPFYASDLYRNEYPNDPSMTNLDNWHDLEEKHNDLFSGMYNFCLRADD